MRARFRATPVARAAVCALACVIGCAATRPAAAQASPYLPLDDSRVPLLEHLITRGDVDDPSPMLRPFRFADAARVLAAADTAPATGTGAEIHRLRLAFTEDTAPSRWEAEVSAGGQAFTQRRRDVFHLGGNGGVEPYGEIGARGAIGPVAYASRVAVEPRLFGDPDWPNGPRPGREHEHVVARLADGYLSAQFKFGSLEYGQLLRNWGPVGLPGISLSDYGYQRQGLALHLGAGPVRLDAIASDLRSGLDSTGSVINRYLIVHRLEGRLTHKFRLALWEAIIIAGRGRVLETPFANPLSPSVLANTFGIDDLNSNDMIGADLHWRADRRLTIEAQLALDDFQFNNRNLTPDRWAFTVGASGPLGGRLAWRALYTQVSSLALRTADSTENFTDAGVGTGRTFTDLDLALVSVSVPVAGSFLVSPELALLRQGEGRINDPFPARNAAGEVTVPGLFIGTVAHTYRAGLRVSGRRGPFDLAADAGLNHVTNDQNQPGVTANRFVAHVQATLAWRRRGRF
ncbi:MAG TPA: hypothetical protein VFW66_05250 [Gemmatimonadales bacterium]|nr:hypothetical protein [Gemmatimonadales bacterium]